MKMVASVENGNGLLFGGRRVSRDEEVYKDMLRSLGEGERLWMSAYSAKLFDFCTDKRISVDEGFLKKASQGDVCFIEDGCCLKDYHIFDEIILYRWNRSYPSDVVFDIEACGREFFLVSATEFPGKSHQKITKEVYQR